MVWGRQRSFKRWRRSCERPKAMAKSRKKMAKSATQLTVLVVKVTWKKETMVFPNFPTKILQRRI